VLKRIATGDESWDQMVPPQVAEIIRRRGFFGYKKRSRPRIVVAASGACPESVERVSRNLVAYDLASPGEHSPRRLGLGVAPTRTFFCTFLVVISAAPLEFALHARGSASPRFSIFLL
jgi:hypothetical protein